MTASEVGYDVCEVVSHRDQSWLSSFLHLHIRSAFHNFPEVCVCRRPGIDAYHKRLEDFGGHPSQDMTTLSAYLQTWRLKLSHTKTVTTAFHLKNREAKRELKICNNGKLLPYCPTPTYLGVKLDRSLTFRHHLEALRKKLSTRVTLLRRLAGSEWGAGAKTLRTAALSLVYSTAEYCAPVWCRSAHTRLIDSVLNDALRIVTGCLRPTPTDYLPILADIQPPELRRRGATLSLANRATLNPDHILHEQLVGRQNAHQGRLKSRMMPVCTRCTETTG